MKETDLYNPIKTYLENLGFMVKAEIGPIDILAKKDAYYIGVELKLAISLKLIYQAIDRQKLCDKVYIALPKKVINTQKSNIKYFINLLKRLEIGLLAVHHDQVEVILETFGFDLAKSIQSSKKKKAKITKEFMLRQSENIGGTNLKKITHYKEKVIQIAKYLNEFGEKSPKEINAYTGIIDAQNILKKNYYLWFINPSRGVYGLSLIGKNALEALEG